MQPNFYTLLEEFTKENDPKLWKKLVKNNRVHEYLTNKSSMMEKDYKSFVGVAYDHYGAMDFLKAGYFDIRGDGEEYLNW